eukprot:3157315-Rhodomonas_salina.1
MVPWMENLRKIELISGTLRKIPCPIPAVTRYASQKQYFACLTLFAWQYKCNTGYEISAGITTAVIIVYINFKQKLRKSAWVPQPALIHTSLQTACWRRNSVQSLPSEYRRCGQEKGCEGMQHRTISTTTVRHRQNQRAQMRGRRGKRGKLGTRDYGKKDGNDTSGLSVTDRYPRWAGR